MLRVRKDTCVSTKRHTDLEGNAVGSKRNGLGNHPRVDIVPFLVRSNNYKRLVVTCLNADCEDSVETAICLPQTKTHGQPTPRTATALRRQGVRVAVM